MYTIQEVLGNINGRLPLILFAGAVMFIGAYMLYIEAIRIGFKQKTHAVPLFANLYFFAHDMAFILLFRRWFVEVDHWLFKGMWIGLMIFNILELIVLYQTIKYSRSELFPMLSQTQYVGVIGAIFAVAATLFWWIDTLIQDPLFLAHFAITVVMASLMNVTLLLRRRSLQGQSPWLLAGLVLMNIGFFFGYLPTMADVFNAPATYAIGSLIVVINIVQIFVIRRLSANPAPHGLFYNHAH